MKQRGLEDAAAQNFSRMLIEYGPYGPYRHVSRWARHVMGVHVSRKMHYHIVMGSAVLKNILMMMKMTMTMVIMTMTMDDGDDDDDDMMMIQ